MRASWSETDLGPAFVVADTGIGIPRRDIPRLTERFYRVGSDRSRHTGGTGLGLAIVKHVLNAHGARLLIESELGEGSTFTLPVSARPRRRWPPMTARTATLTVPQALGCNISVIVTEPTNRTPIIRSRSCHLRVAVTGVSMKHSRMTMAADGGLLLWTAAGPAFGQAGVDPELPRYEKVSGVSGNLSAAGSDTLANLMTLWGEQFKRHYPNVNIQIQAAGSSTAPTALTEGTANIGPMSRLMRDGEIEAFERRYGYQPTRVAVAIDALSVFVHKDNPIDGLYMYQLDGIFSATRNCAGSEELTRWGQLGLHGSWETAPSSCSGATRCPAPTGISRSVRCAVATSRTASTSSRVRPRWCNRWPPP